MVDGDQIAIAEGRVVAESEIDEGCAGRRGTHEAVGEGPHHDLGEVPGKSSAPVATITTVWRRNSGTTESCSRKFCTVLTTIPSSTAWIMRFTRLAAPPTRTWSSIALQLLAGKQVGPAHDAGAPVAALVYSLSSLGRGQW